MAVVTIKKKRLRREIFRHPWIYENSVERLEGPSENGDVVEIVAPDGRFLAWAFINRNSKLFLRMYSFERAARDPGALFASRVAQAFALRRQVLRLDERCDAYRVIHSEGDGIPGLIVDRYGATLVLSCTSLGTYRYLDPIVEALAAAPGIECIFEIGSARGLRGLEGLPPGRGLLHGTAPGELRVTVDGLIQKVNISGGQKTGLFLDQRDNARLFAETCRDARVLDICCYGGAFGLMALKAGAASVLAFDVSPKAVARVAENAALNKLEQGLSVRKGDLFETLRALRKEGSRYNRIILDPPNFAGTKRDLAKARKAYTEAHSLALSVLEPGGLLTSFTCSHHTSERAFEESLGEAARRGQCAVQVLARLGAGPDHPQEISCPEGRYLKGLLVRRIE